MNDLEHIIIFIVFERDELQVQTNLRIGASKKNDTWIGTYFFYLEQLQESTYFKKCDAK